MPMAAAIHVSVPPGHGIFRTPQKPHLKQQPEVKRYQNPQNQLYLQQVYN